ncbi:MAG: CRISPR-associated endonuclease Cas1 [Opitutales bacterium]|nr:CRISPR-associated endonuclease Cas1 [Opitutales bacterium]
MDPPLILPARMVNEFVYCPRLFYYEFVEGVFAHNADTLAGKAQHKRQDKGSGALAKPAGKSGDGEGEGSAPAAETAAEGPETIHARSVQLGSRELGVVAKLDLVEVRREGGELFDFRVCPVEYKKGRPREGDDGIEIWDADRAQLGLQILLLRENGYPCDEGVLYYRETKQRVTFRLDDETENWIRETVVAARACAAGAIPPPLDDSPKCPRCSLVGICLPDESRLLAQAPPPDPGVQLTLELDADGDPRAAAARINAGPFAAVPEIRVAPLRAGEDVRRLVAPNPETRALYLNTPGHYVSKKDNTLVVKEKKAAVGEFRFHDLHHVALFGPVQVSTAAVQALCERDIPLTYFSMGGWFYGMTRGHSLTNVFTRIEQFATAADPERAVPFARVFVHGKIRNQRTLLMRNHIDPPKETLRALKYLANAALHAGGHAQILGIEGAAAAIYFEHFSGMLKSARDEEPDAPGRSAQQTFSFDFRERNRRPPRDPVNALLSLVYSLLAKDCVLAAYATGFDPYIGFLHQPRFGKPALALDLMEEFRPLVAESAVLSLINKRVLDPGDFVAAGQSVSLDYAARKRVFTAYEQRLAEGVTHPVFGYRVCYRRAIELQARMLAKCLTGEIGQYVPFMTR